MSNPGFPGTSRPVETIIYAKHPDWTIIDIKNNMNKKYLYDPLVLVMNKATLCIGPSSELEWRHLNSLVEFSSEWTRPKVWENGHKNVLGI